MSIIHELREDYRLFRIEHPGYRLLFLLGDIGIFLLKLALFCGFMVLCWYLMSRSPDIETSDRTAGNALAAVETTESRTPELTAERLALLRQIADQEDSSSSAGVLIGQADVEDQSDDAAADVLKLASFDQPNEAVVQVEARRASDNSTVSKSAAAKFTDDVYIAANSENGSWILNQNPSAYTLQLALTTNVEFLVDFARQLQPKFVTVIYPERRNSQGNIQYSLSAGSFSAKAPAEAALSSLSAQVKRYGAHVRPFDEIQGNTSRFLK